MMTLNRRLFLRGLGGAAVAAPARAVARPSATPPADCNRVRRSSFLPVESLILTFYLRPASRATKMRPGARPCGAFSR